jgi:serine protease Do/serine protease DegQ
MTDSPDRARLALSRLFRSRWVAAATGAALLLGASPGWLPAQPAAAARSLAAPAAAQGTAGAAEAQPGALPSLAPMIKRVAPAVVSIGTKSTARGRQGNPLLDDPFFRRFFGVPDGAQPRPREVASVGSGVVVDARNGYVVTNAHVIENADEITVTLIDGRDLKAEIVGRDEPTDVAVVRVKAEGLAQIALGNSDRLEVGDWVVAIGNPFGLQHTVTSGIVSALGRTGISPDSTSIESSIQTDAAINPGNSGGALVNLRGELVGLNSSIYSRSGGNIGIGFAVPVNVVQGVMDQLIKTGSVRRGLLGVNIAAVTPEVATALGLPAPVGALVTEVVRDSAAQKAGVRAGDVITSVNGRTIRTHTELRNTIGLLRLGERVSLSLLRDGQPLALTATLTEPAGGATGPPLPAPGRAPDAPAADAPPHPGLEGALLADAPQGGGVAVREVRAGSPAAAVGLRKGDVIFGANRAATSTLAQLRDAAKGAGPLLLRVRRGESSIVVMLPAAPP